MLPIHPKLNQFMVWIEIIEDCVSVGLMTRCKDDYLKVLISLLQAFNNIGPNINASTHDVVGVVTKAVW